MKPVTVRRHIAAPVELVFDTIAHIENFANAVPHIVRTEIISETKKGAGTRFVETRKMGSQEVTSTLEVSEYIANDRVRIVSDSHGTVWDTLFSVTPSNNGTRLEMAMTAQSRNFLARLTTWIIRGALIRALEIDLDCVKSYCEHSASD